MADVLISVIAHILLITTHEITVWVDVKCSLVNNIVWFSHSKTGTWHAMPQVLLTIYPDSGSELLHHITGPS